MSTVLTVVFYALVMVLVFGALIFIHEFGHFFTARRCGVAVKEFAIGMGPTLVSWKSKKYDTCISFLYTKALKNASISLK